MNRKREKAYRQGMESFYDNKGKLSNPFAKSSEEHWEFERGWAQALRRAPESTMKEFERQSKTDDLADQKKRKLMEMTKDQVKLAYKRMKG